MTASAHAHAPAAEDAGFCIHDRVGYWATREPERVAVSADGLDVTYGTLWTRSAALAAELRRRVGQGERVTVALPRSPGFVVAVLAVLRAGCCYVPMDPSYPARRQELIIADSGARCAIVPPGTRHRPAAAITICADAAEGVPIQAEGAPIQEAWSARTGPGSLAYIIYTSGSTGIPKGVAATHRNVTSLLDGDPRLAVRPGQVVAQFASTAFDASVFEIWAALCNGARLAMLALDEISVAAIGRDLRGYAPDWLFLTTGLFHVLAEHDLDGLSAARTVITGGDVLSPRLIARAASRVPKVYAAYGPTETSVFTSLHQVAAGNEYDRVPLGSPLAGRPMFVLNRWMRPAATGIPGEIYVGGSGMTLGYFGKPRETAECFLPDPFADVPGQVIYRTGDLGLLRPDGEIEFIGRIDRQVKIRGFRVEPGEAETVLDRCEGVESAAVLAVDGPDGEPRLVAYVVPTSEAPASMEDLREAAAERLPGHLQPSYYVQVDTLPLDGNGKVDRGKLPDPWRSRADAGLGPFSAPRTPVEDLVARILAESLGLDCVGRDDDFFALGGNSLQSVRVLERLRSLGISIQASDLFASPTVAGLTALVPDEAVIGGNP